jgi:hypothetical protein
MGMEWKTWFLVFLIVGSTVAYCDDDMSQLVDDAPAGEEAVEAGACRSEVKRPMLSRMHYDRGASIVLDIPANVPQHIQVSGQKVNDIDKVLWDTANRDSKPVGYVTSYGYDRHEDQGRIFYGRNEKSTSSAEVILELLQLMKTSLLSREPMTNQTILIKRVHHGRVRRGNAIANSDLDLLHRLRLLTEAFKFNRWRLIIEVISENDAGELQKQSVSFFMFVSSDRGDYPIDEAFLSWLNGVSGTIDRESEVPSHLQAVNQMIADLETFLGSVERIERG